MTLDLSIADLLTALLTGGAVVVGLAVGGLLLRRGGAHRRADRWLGGFLVAGGLSIAHELVAALELYRLSDHFWITPLLYTFSLGPLLYAAVRSRLDAGWRVERRHWPHAVLPVYQIVHEVLTGFAPLTFKSWFWQTPYANAYSTLDTWVFVASFGLYLAAAARVLAGGAAGTEPRDWLLRLVRGCAVILGVSFLVDAVHLATAELGAGLDWLQFGSTAAYSALFYWAAFTSWLHALHRPSAEAPRQETYGVTDADLRRHAEALRALVADERPYLDPALTLDALARRLGLSDKELSYVLNAGVGKSYTAYINGLRVDEAARRLGDAAHADRTVLDIALASGFASKATFNRAFKQATGRTPSAFRATPKRLRTS